MCVCLCVCERERERGRGRERERQGERERGRERGIEETDCERETRRRRLWQGCACVKTSVTTLSLSIASCSSFFLCLPCRFPSPLHLSLLASRPGAPPPRGPHLVSAPRTCAALLLRSSASRRFTSSSSASAPPAPCVARRMDASSSACTFAGRAPLRLRITLPFMPTTSAGRFGRFYCTARYFVRGCAGQGGEEEKPRGSGCTHPPRGQTGPRMAPTLLRQHPPVDMA